MSEATTSHRQHLFWGGALARTGTVMPAGLALLLGLFLLYGVGIAQPQTIHNAAHDSRHAIAFPCH